MSDRAKLAAQMAELEALAGQLDALADQCGSDYGDIGNSLESMAGEIAGMAARDLAERIRNTESADVKSIGEEAQSLAAKARQMIKTLQAEDAAAYRSQY